MLITFDETSKKIAGGNVLHIAGSEALLRKLPKGNWIGGSTEYFVAQDGGKITGDMLFVTEFPYENFSIKSYDTDAIKNVAVDAFDNGFSLVIMPYDSAMHKIYAANAPEYKDLFIKNIVGWVSGVNPSVSGQTPITVNGQTGEVHTENAAVLHICVPGDKSVIIGVVNMFTPNEDSPVIEFQEEKFSAVKCLIDGKEAVFADYIAENNIDTKLPIVGDYYGNGVNVSFRSIEDGVVNFYSPVFVGIKYKFSKTMPDYVKEFSGHVSEHLAGLDTKAVFSCNCLLNFIHGELEGRNTGHFTGPITYGEIACQLLSQTLVYVSVV